jgi:hypothetical protein
MRTKLMLVVGLVGAFLGRAEAGTLKQVRLEQGRYPDNRIAAPLFNTDKVAPLRIGLTAGYGSGKIKVMRSLGNMFTKGVSHELLPSIDLAALLGEAARSEAKAMGFRVADAAGEVWDVSGTLQDVYLESKRITGYGAMISWGYMRLDLQIKAPGGAVQTRAWRLHSFFGKMQSGGFSSKGDAETALANLLVEGAQELVTRLNHDFLKAPALPDIDKKLRAVASGGVKSHEADLYVVGLAAGASAVAPLLERLAKEESEDERAKIVNALARIGAPEAIAPLAARYAKEDEDCRWYTLKAMDYVGGDTARAFIKDTGLGDEEEECARLARRILG